ncbi:hypothetical protein HHK36_012808 [Tetracentron sinense]|uniref:Non-haem dioxygenase N-terminal domain-containing protein n=1 Tax=Tetracentron sinense TaxID=13715 RepID=A0A834Z9R8_TETSI|nr:hypothetical protein HHK36_012808 [Tetracentron sinense]
MFTPKKDYIDGGNDHGVSEKVELEMKASENTQKVVPVEQEKEELINEVLKASLEEVNYSIRKSSIIEMKQTMDITSAGEFPAGIVPAYDRMKELKVFDDTKAGVKGLVDVGVVKVPRIFIQSPEELTEEIDSHPTYFEVLVIDLDGINKDDPHKEIVDQVRAASEMWGFFEVGHHGIPLSMMAEMTEGIRRFNEQDHEVKK